MKPKTTDTITFQAQGLPGTNSLTVSHLAHFLVPRIQTAIYGSVTAAGYSGQFILFGPSLEGGKACRWLISDQIEAEWLRATKAVLQSLYAEPIFSVMGDVVTKSDAQRQFAEAYRWFNTWARHQCLPRTASVSHASTRQIEKFVRKNYAKNRSRLVRLRKFVDAGKAFSPEVHGPEGPTLPRKVK